MSDMSYSELRAEIHKRYEAETEDARVRRDRRLAAVDEFEALGWPVSAPLNDGTENGDMAPRQRPQQPGPEPVGVPRHPPLKRAVEEAIENMPGQFNITEIVKQIREVYPGMVPDNRRASVSSTLLSLERSGIIRVFERGRGARPTVYTKDFLEDDINTADNNAPLQIAN